MPSFIALLALSASASEGLWRPEQTKELAEELKLLGATTIDPAALGDLTKAPLGATVDLDFCTGAFVSPDGLIVTAYHCVTDGLQFASEPGEDLMTNGFYAPTREDERYAGPGFKVHVTLSTRDVGQEVLAGARKLDGRARFDMIEKNIQEITSKCEQESGVHCEVATYGQGTEYQLVRQLELEDVRLVMAPPLDVGYFGGDKDNWQWPRHSGDFAFLRAYSKSDNRPSTYAPENVAYHPPVYLPTAPIGPKPGDFVMVPGYPGGTYRWRTAAEFDFAMNDDYPRRLKTERDIMQLLSYAAEKDRSLEQMVSARTFNLSNDVLYYEGNLVAFKRTNLAERKWEFEGDLAKWIASDTERASRFGDVLDRIGAIEAEEASVGERDFTATRMRKNSAQLDAALTIYKLALENKKPDKDRAAGFHLRDRTDLIDGFAEADADYNERIDRAILRYFLLEALSLPKGLRIAELDAWFEAQGGKGSPEDRLDNILDDLYINEDLVDPDRRKALMDTTPWFLVENGNKWFTLAQALHPYYERLEASKARREADWLTLRPRYIEAVREFLPQARPRYLPTVGGFAPGLFYYDANETLRVTIGKVDGYVPRDGLIAAAQTSVLGVKEKSADGSPYGVPDTLKAGLEGAVWGPYANPAMGSVVANYVTTLDTARGSSGSPTVDAQGRWCGIIFDGNYESMAADWVFDEKITRSIHTDVGYVLWYLDAVAGADPLLTELGITPSLATVEVKQQGDTGGSQGTLFP